MTPRQATLVLGAKVEDIIWSVSREAFLVGFTAGAALTAVVLGLIWLALL